MRSSERQLGLLWGGAAALLVASAPFASRLAGALPACPLRSLTGLPCLSCGATRAAVSLSQLDLVSAVLWNPLAAAGWLVVVIGGLAAGAASIANHPLPKLPRRLSWPSRGAALAVIVVNWLYLYSRGV